MSGSRKKEKPLPEYVRDAIAIFGVKPMSQEHHTKLRWLMAERASQDLSLSGTAVKLLVNVMSLDMHAKHGGVVFSSLATISTRMSIHQNTIRSAWTSLCAEGYFDRYPDDDDRTSGFTNVYIPIWPDPSKKAQGFATAEGTADPSKKAQGSRRGDASRFKARKVAAPLQKHGGVRRPDIRTNPSKNMETHPSNIVETHPSTSLETTPLTRTLGRDPGGGAALQAPASASVANDQQSGCISNPDQHSTNPGHHDDTPRAAPKGALGAGDKPRGYRRPTPEMLAKWAAREKVRNTQSNDDDAPF